MRQRRIAVFDFDAEGRGEVAGAVASYFTRDGPAVEVAEYGDIPSLAHGFRDVPFEMLFAVIRGMMGVEAARIIREADRVLPIFLISETGDYALEGYRLRALHYLLLPVTESQLAAAAGRLETECLKGLRSCESAVSSYRFGRAANDAIGEEQTG